MTDQTSEVVQVFVESAPEHSGMVIRIHPSDWLTQRTSLLAWIESEIDAALKEKAEAVRQEQYAAGPKGKLP